MELDTPVVDTPAPLVEPVKAPESTSLSEHEALFPGKDTPKPAKTDAAELQPVAEEKGRHRAQSQQATAEDTEQIATLTKRLRKAEDASGIARVGGESERVYQLRRRAELAESRRERDTLKAELETWKAKTDPKPVAPAPAPDAGKPFPPFETWATTHAEQSWDDYFDARARFVAKQEWAAADAARAKTETDAKAKVDAERITATWNTRVDAARKKYADFDDVVLKPATTPIPDGSAADAFILDDDSGADVLYHLLSHPDEVPALLALGPLQQVKALTLLAQRLTTPPQTQAASTGSAVLQPVAQVPRPPNPVRTGPVKTGDTPPGDGASLAEHEKFYPAKRR